MSEQRRPGRGLGRHSGGELRAGRKALFSQLASGRKDLRKRTSPRRCVRLEPERDQPRHGDGAEALIRNAVRVELSRNSQRRSPRPVQAADAATVVKHQEAVAARTGHVRLDHAKGRSGRQERIDGIAAGVQKSHPRL